MGSSLRGYTTDRTGKNWGMMSIMGPSVSLSSAGPQAYRGGRARAQSARYFPRSRKWMPLATFGSNRRSISANTFLWTLWAGRTCCRRRTGLFAGVTLSPSSSSTLSSPRKQVAISPPPSTSTVRTHLPRVHRTIQDEYTVLFRSNLHDLHSCS